MKLLFNIRNKIDDIYLHHPQITGYIVRLLITLVILLILRANIGFNAILTDTLFVIAFSLVCAFVPAKPLALILAIYAVVQIFSLSAGAGLFTCLLFVIIYLIYFRFNTNTGYVILLIPLLCLIRLPILIPLVLAVCASAGSVISIILGFIVFYFLRYIHVTAAVLSGIVENGEVNKMSMIISGVFTYREMWYTIVCVVLMFFACYYLKKININKSNEMAIAIGSGVYLISILLCTLLFGTITTQKLTQLVMGCIVSCLAAMIISAVVLPLDYRRTELLEFEDEEYKYFVRAVPKSSISKESVRIKRIYSRKQASADKVREAEK